MAEIPPDGTKKQSWEESVMKLRSTLKMQFSNFNDDTFLLLDSFFKLSIQQNNQMEIILVENNRLAELCTKNNVDMTPPEIKTKNRVDSSKPLTPVKKPVISKQSI